MKKILHFSIIDLLREIVSAKNLVEKTEVPKEVYPYKNWLTQFLNYTENGINNISYYLEIEVDDKDVINAATADFIRFRNTFSLINNTYLPLLVRTQKTDHLALKFINWLHGEHVETQNHPFIIANGDFGIYPSKEFPIRYHLPVTSQVSLLYFPLFFHEFGHLLFVKHKDEMVDLIKEFQSNIDKILTLPVYKFDNKSNPEIIKRNLIIETWYEWMEELFCDTIGLIIGGPSFLHAFSHFIKFTGSSAYYVTEKDLARRSHPVAWLRVKLLAEKSERIGLQNEAKEILRNWQTIADNLNISEEYYGYYDKDFHNHIVRTLDNMIIEANPIQFNDYLKNNIHLNYIQILNRAWIKYFESQSKYLEWEKEILGELVEN
jgi:hypothetical protein